MSGSLLTDQAGAGAANQDKPNRERSLPRSLPATWSPPVDATLMAWLLEDQSHGGRSSMGFDLHKSHKGARGCVT